MIQTEMSADTRALADMLAATPVGEVATLAAMSETIGRDITTCRHLLAAARRIAQREHGAVFVTDRGIGYRRLPAEEVARVVGSSARQHVRRTAGRAKRALIAGTNSANDLRPDVQRRLAAEISAMALLEHISRDTTVKPAADAPLKPTPVAVTARAFLAGFAPRDA